MDDKQFKELTIVEKLSLKYKSLTDNKAGEAAKIGLTALGVGVLDKVAALPADKLEKKQLYEFINELGERINNLEDTVLSNEFYSSFKRSARSLIETDQQHKAKRFAQILARAVNDNLSNWNEPQQAIKIQEELEDRHIEVLSEIAKIDDEWFVLGVPGSTYPDLITRLSGFKPFLLNLIVSDLIGQGLLNDTDVDRSGTNSVSLLKLSDAGKWFLDYISD